jgi:hypothetical protein
MPLEPIDAKVSVNGNGVTVPSPIRGMQMTQAVPASVLELAPGGNYRQPRFHWGLPRYSRRWSSSR